MDKDYRTLICIPVINDIITVNSYKSVYYGKLSRDTNLSTDSRNNMKFLVFKFNLAKNTGFDLKDNVSKLTLTEETVTITKENKLKYK